MNLCPHAVNSQRLFCSQKSWVEMLVLKLSGIHIPINIALAKSFPSKYRKGHRYSNSKESLKCSEKWILRF